MTYRLERDAPKLVDEILAAPPDRQRDAAVAVAELALQRNGVLDAPVVALVDALRAGDLGRVQAEAVRLREQADEAAFDLFDGVDDGWASEEDAGRAFCRARALHALEMAAMDDPALSALEAAYEAAAGVAVEPVELVVRAALTA